MPDVIEVRYLRAYTVRVKFDDGVQGDVDVSRSFKGPVCEPLRDREYFKQVRVNPDLGTIVWPNGADVALRGRAGVAQTLLSVLWQGAVPMLLTGGGCFVETADSS